MKISLTTTLLAIAMVFSSSCASASRNLNGTDDALSSELQEQEWWELLNETGNAVWDELQDQEYWELLEYFAFLDVQDEYGSSKMPTSSSSSSKHPKGRSEGKGKGKGKGSSKMAQHFQNSTNTRTGGPGRMRRCFFPVPFCGSGRSCTNWHNPSFPATHFNVDDRWEREVWRRGGLQSGGWVSELWLWLYMPDLLPHARRNYRTRVVNELGLGTQGRPVCVNTRTGDEVHNLGGRHVPLLNRTRCIPTGFPGLATLSYHGRASRRRCCNMREPLFSTNGMLRCT